MKRAVFFSSSMAPMFRRYIDLKRALGCDFSDQCQVLHSLDRFLRDSTNHSPDLTSGAFQQWCRTQEKLASRTAALPNADDLQLLPLSPPHRTALLFAGSLTFPKGASEDQAIHFFSESGVARLLVDCSSFRTDAQLSSSA